MLASLLVLGALAASSLATSSLASAKPRGLKATFAPDKVILDGLPNELEGDWRDLTHAVKGSKPSSDDLSARAVINYDDRFIYVGADVKDDQLTGGGDHVELLLGIPGGGTLSLKMYPGVPGKSRAAVKSSRGSVRGAKIVEAPKPGGYSIEAKIPWSAIPKSSTIRIGYRGALFVHDADGSRAVTSVIGSADTRSYGSLPPISTEAEIALGSGMLREKNLTAAPRFNLMADVVGDKLQERVLVYGRYLAVLGPGYRDGQQYYFRDLGANADKGGLPKLELRDYTGDGKPDLFVRKVVRGSKGSVEVVEILSYHSGGDIPDQVFAQEVALKLGGGSIDNEFKLSGRGSRTRIVLKAGKAKGIDSARFRQESNTGAAPVLVPWGPIASQTYQMKNGKFAMVDEQRKELDAPPPPPRSSGSDRGHASSPRPRPRRSSPEPKGANLGGVYALYKKKARVRGAPRFDVRANLAEDKRKERLVVHGRDLVVFGEAYKGGRGFAAVTLAQFEKASDIKSVTARDTSGNGMSEIVVKGLIRSPLPSDIGDGDMVRTVVMVYALRRGQFERLFAAEVGRAIGNKRVEAKLKFSRAGIILKPGRAVGYSEATYPWRQKDAPDGGFEPLLLPWGGIDKIRLRYDGRAFVR
jgi:hypothetical protein